MPIDLTQITELKKILSDRFDTTLHIRDTFFGQSFEVDGLSPDGKDFIENYFAERGRHVVWSENLSGFRLEEMRLC